MIPPCKPKLPRADKILPYLKQIDENRYYSNFGPLLLHLEQRLADFLSIKQSQLTTCSTGTSALELAMAALDLPRSSSILVPSFTFIASAHAILSQGLNPYFCDVEEKSWALTPQIAYKAIENSNSKISLIIPVAPFGVIPDYDGWQEFYKKTGIPILIDGAALSPKDIQVRQGIVTTLSLHATKLLNAGEGGLIVAEDDHLIRRARQISNFDLLNDNGVSSSAMNAKMSEYHAAVAHASLDEWENIENDFKRVAKRYHENLKNVPDIQLLTGYGEERFNSFCLVIALHSSAEELAKREIYTRPWWRKGCHHEPLFKNADRTDLEVTEKIAANYLGLPCYRDLDDEKIDFICNVLIEHQNQAEIKI